MLWPHYLRTIPSLSIVALTPTLPAMKMAETVPAGFEISSRPLGPKNTVCRYRTTRDLTLNPLAIEEAVMTAEPDGRSALRLRFACSELADWSQTDLRHGAVPGRRCYRQRPPSVADPTPPRCTCVCRVRQSG